MEMTIIEFEDSKLSEIKTINSETEQNMTNKDENMYSTSLKHVFYITAFRQIIANDHTACNFIVFVL